MRMRMVAAAEKCWRLAQPCVLYSPPRLTAVAGFLGSIRFKGTLCLNAFLALDGINTILTLVLVAELFCNFEAVVHAIGERPTRLRRACEHVHHAKHVHHAASRAFPCDPCSPPTDPHETGKFDTQHSKTVLRAAQWLILLFLVLQITALITALLVRAGPHRPRAGRTTANELPQRVAMRWLWHD